jgi:hypothetical protein
MSEVEPPTLSKGRWKENHPTVSFRVSLSDRHRLDELVRQEGISLSEILHRALGLIDKQVVNGRAKFQQGRRVGHQDGHDDGYLEGQSDTMGQFIVPCCRCGQALVMDDRNPAIRRKLRLVFRGWYHAQGCPTSPPK